MDTQQVYSSATRYFPQANFQPQNRFVARLLPAHLHLKRFPENLTYVYRRKAHRKLHICRGGEWNEDLDRWTLFPCGNKTCPRCWRRFAKRKRKQLAKQVDNSLHWHHVWVKTNMPRQGRKPQLNFTAFLKDIAHEYPDSTIIWVKHVGWHGNIHYHLMLGTTGPVNLEWIREQWHHHYPSQDTPCNEAHAKAKAHLHPFRLLRYLLGLSWNKATNQYRRKHPPWRGLTGCVAKAYCVHRGKLLTTKPTYPG